MTDDEQTGAPSTDSQVKRKRWMPEASAETAAALRLLTVRPWLLAERDSEAIAAIRRNLPAIRDALGRLGWVLVMERDFVRLRKSPPVRRLAWSAEGPTPQQASWFFLLVAAAESVGPRVGLANLVTAARAAAAEAGLPVTNDLTERRAIVSALRMLDERGVVVQVDGDLEGFVKDENAPVLLAVHHTRLAHVIAHYAPSDPNDDPDAWISQLERESDPARRMRRKLIEDTVVYVDDLDEAEADWLSRRVRDDAGPLAIAFGLHLERRAEGAALVVPDDAFRYPHELGPTPFPAPATVPHATLLLCEHAATAGLVAQVGQGPGIGWRGLSESGIKDYLRDCATRRADGPGGWKRELADNPELLASEVLGFLTSLDLVRISQDESAGRTWWFSPATARWSLDREATGRRT
jgi:uncharacterized protein (TIGR02678 family)